MRIFDAMQQNQFRLERSPDYDEIRLKWEKKTNTGNCFYRMEKKILMKKGKIEIQREKRRICFTCWKYSRSISAFFSHRSEPSLPGWEKITRVPFIKFLPTMNRSWSPAAGDSHNDFLQISGNPGNWADEGNGGRIRWNYRPISRRKRDKMNNRNQKSK